MSEIQHSFFGQMLPRVIAAATCALAPRLLSAAELVQPELSIGLRGVVGGTIETGEPLRVAVRMQVPRDIPATIRLAPASGSWVDAISIEIARDGAAPALRRAEPAEQPKTRDVTVNRTRVAGGLWRFSSEKMKGLAPGDYVVRAKLAITQSPHWAGEVLAEEVPLTIVAVSDDPARKEQRIIARTQEALSQGQHEEAARQLDELLGAVPENVRALTLRAALAANARNFRAASVCIKLAFKTLPAGELHPPVELVDVQNQMMHVLLTKEDAVNAPAPPAWTWPPRSVVEALEKREAAAVGELRHTSPPAETSGYVPKPEQATAPVPAPPANPPQTKQNKSSPPPATATPKSAPPTSPPPAPVSANQATGFAGVWNTSFGPVTLTVDGSKVTGTYPRNGGTLQGTLEGNVLRFDWKQTNNSGRGVFTLAPDGNSFTGTFTYGATADPATSRNTWNGTRTN